MDEWMSGEWMEGQMDRWMDEFLIPGFLHAADLWAEWRMAHIPSDKFPVIFHGSSMEK